MLGAAPLSTYPAISTPQAVSSDAEATTNKESEIPEIRSHRSLRREMLWERAHRVTRSPAILGKDSASKSTQVDAADRHKRTHGADSTPSGFRFARLGPTSSSFHLSLSSPPPTLRISIKFINSAMSQTQTMKAVVYSKPFEVSVEAVPIPKILQASDVIVKVTTSAICGSDLHMFELSDIL